MMAILHPQSEEISRSKCIEWYHIPLVEDVYYVSYDSANFTTLATKIKWLQDHHEKGREIATNAMDFADRFLTEQCASWYLYRVLRTYSKVYQPLDPTRTDAEQWLQRGYFTKVVELSPRKSRVRVNLFRGVLAND